MLRLQPTPRKIGVKISGDFQDIQHFIHSIENFQKKIHQNISQKNTMSTELLGDLLFCLRAAIQGTRQIESVNNGAAEMGQLFVDLDTAQAESIFRERRRYAQGNLYYAVTINSIEVIGYLRCFYKIFINQSSTILNNEDSTLYDTEKATLYQFYCSLRQAVCSMSKRRTYAIFMESLSK